MPVKNKIISFEAGVHCLKQGGLLIYPTETFFAVGCMVHGNNCLESIYKAKRRPHNRAVPLLAAHMEQVETVANLNVQERKLAEEFWPGPLTIITSARANVPRLACANDGKLALRISSHPLATALASACKDLLICSSANISGQEAVKDYKLLSYELLQEVQGIVFDEKRPMGGLASTLVEVVGDNLLSIRRQGAISKQSLMENGWEVI